jgi:spindle assembly abnormal protein 6
MIRSLDTSVGGESAIGDSGTLFDSNVPVFTKQQDREEVLKQLGVCIICGRGGANGVSRSVSVRITDPTDPFFLFTMELLEDDYGAFKQRMELLVDFLGFPKYLVSMLQGVSNGSPHHIVSFVIDSKNSSHGILRILEKTDFRTVEHISLDTTKQGDVGQKRYLAEKFIFFEQAFHRSEGERALETRSLTTQLSDCRDDLEAARRERDELKERLRLEASVAESGQLSAVAKLSDEHAREVKRLQQQFDHERSTLLAKLDAVQSTAVSDCKQKDLEIAALRTQCAALETSEINLKSSLRISTETLKTKTYELEQLQSSNDELLAFRASATRSMSDKELQHVQTTERLRNALENLRGKDEELKALRSQYEKQDNYLRILNDQNQQATKKIDTSEASLQKAHYIIANQIQTIRSLKEKQTSTASELQATQALVSERNSAIERLRSEGQLSNEKIDLLQKKVSDLKDQLQKLDESNAATAAQLKQSQDALIHMQRHASVGARNWGSSASAIPDVYREFSRNLHTSVDTTGSSSAAGGMRPPAGSENVLAGVSSRFGGVSQTLSSQPVNPPTLGKVALPSVGAGEVLGASKQSVQPVSAYFAN